MKKLGFPHALSSWAVFLNGPTLMRRSLLPACSDSVGMGRPLELRWNGPDTKTDDSTLLRVTHCGIADGGLTAQQHLLSRTECVGQQGFWLGDGDSSLMQESCLKHTQLTVERYPRVKDVSDGALLFERVRDFPRSESLLVVDVAGGLGGRRDHEQVNLAEARFVFFEKDSRSCAVILHPGVILTNTPIRILGLREGFVFSLLRSLASSGALPLRVEGALYSGVLTLERPSHGLSNEVGEIGARDGLLLDPGGTLIEIVLAGSCDPGH